VADFILQENNFPRKDWRRFLSRTLYDVGTERHRINLDFGFGISLPCDVNLITLPSSSAFNDTFLHLHTEYAWPPAKGESGHETRYDYVFPGKLADDDEAYLIPRIDAYLNQLLEDSESFRHFPAWFSELRVLRDVYWMYHSLPKDQRKPLEQALKLLILVHVGGDVQVRRDDNFLRIVRHFLPGYNNYNVKACLIRAQLGPIFSGLSHKLMREILTELEILSPSKDIFKYPVIVGTFSVLLMAMESLQYHFAKIPFHASHDNPSKLQPSDKEPTIRNLDEFDGADVLLRFYKATRCHAELGTISSRSPFPTYVTNPGVDTIGFLDNLKKMTIEIRPYLQDLAQSKTVARNDLSRFFDRLLARMYLLPGETDL
jgi:hypothetical protein